MDNNGLILSVNTYRKDLDIIHLVDYYGIIKHSALVTIQSALMFAAEKSNEYSLIAKYVAISQNIEEIINESIQNTLHGGCGNEID